MASQDEGLVDFVIIEAHKENIQSLPSGRSAKALAALYSPPLASQPTPTDAHSAERAVFDAELAQIEDSDDPLDVYDRYVKWTLNTYPSAQSTAQSRLLPLLERATKAFLADQHYKNDPRYLRIWLHYVGLFADAPRETFIFMARNGVGQELALFYEEYAAWLEGQERWTQAEEVYGIGIEKEARPVERLVRKFGEFERRKAALPADVADRPDSPALPVVRQVLGQKVDPFAAAAAATAQQEAKADPKGKKKSAKMAIFADDSGEKESAMGSKDGQSWDNIGTLHSRKKENTAEPSSWVGQTMKVGKTNAGVEKMKIFRRREAWAINLAAVYPGGEDSNVEYGFEELMARHRGWLDRDWSAENRALKEQETRKKLAPPTEQKTKKKTGFAIFQDHGEAEAKPTVEALPLQSRTESIPIRTVILNDENNENVLQRQAQTKQDDIAKRMRREERANRTRKIKMTQVREEKKETQTVQLNLASPTGPKMKRNKKSADPTMTINTREAMDEIYGIFGQPVAEKAETEDEEDDSDDDDDDYTSGGESTTTGKMSAATSEYGDETRNEIMQAYGNQVELHSDAAEVNEPEEEETTEADDKTNVTAWSDFTTSKHVPREDADEDCSPRLARLQIFQDDVSPHSPLLQAVPEVMTPVGEEEEHSPFPNTRYIPIPPEDYEPNSGTYRDRAAMMNNRLPFMTPIAEATESSIGTSRTDKEKDYFTAKTPSRLAHAQAVLPILEDGDENEPWSSPFQDHAGEIASKVKPLALAPVPADGPLIRDAQVNPVDPMVRDFILAHPRTRLQHHPGFHDHQDVDSGRVAEIRKFAKALSKKGCSGAADNKMGSTLALPPMLDFRNAGAAYTIRRELGAGAFAPVYLVEVHSGEEGEPSLAAMKMETSPPSAWEFHMLCLAHSRLEMSRAAESLVRAQELHLFSDASYLVEAFSDSGTLLDLVNAGRSVEGCSGGSGAGLEESLAMFYTVELLRTVEALHKSGIIHGDIKADNVLVRLPQSSSSSLDEPYSPSGEGSWSAHGITLIDFGRAIDVRCFPAETRFIADWTTSDADCTEMRDGRPWTYQPDYHGIAAVAHTLLWGKYMAVVTDRNPSGEAGIGAVHYRPRENRKRYWADVWGGFFSLMLNSAAREFVAVEAEGRLPALNGVRKVRERMEEWLVSSDGGGRGEGLRARLRRVEEVVRRRR
ncbi:hypothetical protein ANO11243_035620 [Dothideomycetidae sp. 11243]|nr:hypothetical protein ANO11243_035620 [fungal sp. No.11243]